MPDESIYDVIKVRRVAELEAELAEKLDGTE